MTNDTYNTEKVFHLNFEHIYHFSVHAISKLEKKIRISSFILTGVLYINTEEKVRLKYSLNYRSTIKK